MKWLVSLNMAQTQWNDVSCEKYSDVIGLDFVT